jgi:excisionase family DNA binding protein
MQLGEEARRDAEWRETRLLRPREVAAMFDVTPDTVSRWARNGKLECIRTVGGHRRFPLEAVQRAVREGRFTGSRR